MAAPPTTRTDLSQATADVSIFFGLTGAFFVAAPLLITLARVLRFPTHGVSAMFSTMPSMSKRRALASQFRSYLYAHSPWGYWLDVGQAACSAVSCLLYIVVAYTAVEYEWVTDLEVRGGAGGQERGGG